jgi:hypothetical protein
MKENTPVSPRKGSRCKALLAISIAAAVFLPIPMILFVQVLLNTTSKSTRKVHEGYVSMALINYSDFRGHLPYPVIRNSTPGRLTEYAKPTSDDPPLYSWRVEIIPYLEGWHGKWDRTKSWDDPRNSQLAELSDFYNSRSTLLKDDKRLFPDTELLAITGPGTAFGDGKMQPMATRDVPPQTILVVESRSSGIPWPAPGDFDIRIMPRKINPSDGKGISGQSRDGFHVMFADGKVWFLSSKVPYDSIQRFFRTEDSKRYDREQLLGPFALRRVP